MKNLEVDMGRYIIDEVEMEEYDLSLDRVSRPFAKKGVEQLKRSPMRRKDKMRPEEVIKPKAKRNHRKIQHRIKYEQID